jgi:hypothetical protein
MSMTSDERHKEMSDAIARLTTLVENSARGNAGSALGEHHQEVAHHHQQHDTEAQQRRAADVMVHPHAAAGRGRGNGRGGGAQPAVHGAEFGAYGDAHIPRAHGLGRRDAVGPIYDDYNADGRLSPRRQQFQQAHNRRHQDDDDVITKPKFTMPTFDGTDEVEAYLAWELKVDKLFRMNRYSDQRKLDLAVAALDGYAAAWWERCVQQRMEYHEPRVNTWDELKRQMRARFVPHNYKRSLYEKLVGLKQLSKTVDEYYKEMETIIIHADVRETQEQTMARFNAGLNYSIRRIVNHHPYTTMVELMHQAREAEKQVHDDTKYAARQRYSPGSFS